MRTYRVHVADNGGWKPARLMTTEDSRVVYILDTGEIMILDQDYLYYVSQDEDRYLYIMSDTTVHLFAFKTGEKVNAFVSNLRENTVKNMLAEEGNADVPDIPESFTS